MKNRRFRPMTRFISKTVKDAHWLQWKMNRNPRVICRIVPLPMTLSDP